MSTIVPRSEEEAHQELKKDTAIEVEDPGAEAEAEPGKNDLDHSILSDFMGHVGEASGRIWDNMVKVKGKAGDKIHDLDVSATHMMETGAQGLADMAHSRNE